MRRADPPRGRYARKRRSAETAAIRPSGGVLDGLQAEIAVAHQREAQAVGRVREMRRRVAEIIGRAVSAGIPYDVIARVVLRARLGRAPTIDERLREADRLRQRRSRHRVTEGHAGRQPPRLGSVSPGVLCSSEVTNMAQKLVKKTTTIEEFVEDGGLHGADLDENLDDAEGDEGDDEAEPAPAPSRRRR